MGAENEFYSMAATLGRRVRTYTKSLYKKPGLLLLLLRGFFAIRVVLPTRVGSYSYAPSPYGCHLMKKSVIKVRVPVAPSRGAVEKKGRIFPKPKKQVFR